MKSTGRKVRSEEEEKEAGDDACMELEMVSRAPDTSVVAPAVGMMIENPMSKPKSAAVLQPKQELGKVPEKVPELDVESRKKSKKMAKQKDKEKLRKNELQMFFDKKMWTKVEAQNGIPEYYWNTKTGETSWNKPKTGDGEV